MDLVFISRIRAKDGNPSEAQTHTIPQAGRPPRPTLSSDSAFQPGQKRPRSTLGRYGIMLPRTGASAGFLIAVNMVSKWLSSSTFRRNGVGMTMPRGIFSTRASTLAPARLQHPARAAKTMLLVLRDIHDHVSPKPTAVAYRIRTPINLVRALRARAWLLSGRTHGPDHGSSSRRGKCTEDLQQGQPRFSRGP